MAPPVLAQEVLSERGNQVRGGLHDISWPEDSRLLDFCGHGTRVAQVPLGNKQRPGLTAWNLLPSLYQSITVWNQLTCGLDGIGYLQALCQDLSKQ